MEESWSKRGRHLRTILLAFLVVKRWQFLQSDTIVSVSVRKDNFLFKTANVWSRLGTKTSIKRCLFATPLQANGRQIRGSKFRSLAFTLAAQSCFLRWMYATKQRTANYEIMMASQPLIIYHMPIFNIIVIDLKLIYQNCKHTLNLWMTSKPPTIYHMPHLQHYPN